MFNTGRQRIARSVHPARGERGQSEGALAGAVLDALSTIGVVAARVAACLDGDCESESGEDGEELHVVGLIGRWMCFVVMFEADRCWDIVVCERSVVG